MLLKQTAHQTGRWRLVDGAGRLLQKAKKMLVTLLQKHLRVESAK